MRNPASRQDFTAMPGAALLLVIFVWFIYRFITNGSPPERLNRSTNGERRITVPDENTSSGDNSLSSRSESAKEWDRWEATDMSLYKRPGSPYWWSKLYAPNGKVLQFSTSKTTKLEALKVEREKAVELDKRNATGAPYVALASLVVEFINQKRTNKVKRSSDAWVESLTRYLEKLVVPHFGADADIRFIDVEALERYRDARLQKVEPVSVCKELSALRLLVKFAVQKKLIPPPGPTIKNPYWKFEPKWRLLSKDELTRVLHALEFPSPTQLRNGRFRMTAAQVDAAAARVAAGEAVRALAKEMGVHHSTLQSALKTKHRRERYGRRRPARDRELFPYFLLKANTGLRGGELEGLEWEMVDWEHRILRLPGRITKTRRPRNVDLNEQGIHALRLLGDKDSSGRIFVQKNHYLAWHAAVARAGIKGRVRPHDLRHTIGTMMHSSGASTPVIRDLLGHATMMMANLYAHSYDEERKRAIERVAIGSRMSENMPVMRSEAQGNALAEPAADPATTLSLGSQAASGSSVAVAKNVTIEGPQMLPKADTGDGEYKSEADRNPVINRN